MKASDVMTERPLCTCREDASVQQVSQMMVEYDIGSIPVLDWQGKLEGMVTDRDLCCRVLAKGMSTETPVKDVMSTSLQYVLPDTELHAVEEIMRENKIRRLPVVQDGLKVIGLISTSDLLHHCHSPAEEQEVAEMLDLIATP